MSDESDLRELEARRIDGICNRKRELLESVLDDSLIHVHMSGKVDDKAHAVDGVMKNQFIAIERPDMKVTVFGDAALLTGIQVAHLRRPDGTEVALRAVAIQVARKTPQGWKFVAYQVTKDDTQPQ